MYIYKSNTENVEECFYNSSNIFYTKLEDIPNEFKKLTVVFKNGSQYLYKDVDVMEYIRFRDSESTGKAFSSIISTKVNGQPKFPYVRLSDANMEELNNKLEELKKESTQLIEDEENIEKTEHNKSLVEGINATVQQSKDNIELKLTSQHSETVLTFATSDTESLVRMLMWLNIDYNFLVV